MKATSLLFLLLAQAATQPPTFKSGINIVEVDVVVMDRSGRPVRGLRREDFEVLEDGKPVEVTSFAAVDIPVAAPVSGEPAADRSGGAVGSNDQPEDGRVLLIVLDDYHVSFDAGRAVASRAIARKLVEQMGPSDLASVIATSGRTSSQAEFTSDKARLLEAIAKFFPQSEYAASGLTGPLPGQNAASRGRGMDFDAEIKTRWAMDALSNAAKALATIPHRRKAVLLVSQGLPVSVEEIVTNQNASGAFQAFRDFLLTAQRSNIVIYPMDPCGLDLDGGCNTSSRQNLQSLAEATGGFAVTNTNAPEQSVERMMAESGTYYLLGYSSPAAPYDGRRHRIRVRTREAGLQIRAREGYVSPRKPPRSAPAASGVDVLSEAAIQSRGLTMRIAAVPAPLGTKPGATVAVGIEVPAAEAIRAGVIDFSVMAVDANGKVRARQRFRSNFESKNTAPAGWARLGSRVDVPPGRYQIRLAAAGASGPGGSVFTEVLVPDFTDDLALGGLSLATPAATTARLAELLAGVVPLVPLGLREFHAGAPLVAQLPIRASPRSGAIRVEARLTRGGAAVPLESTPPASDYSGPSGAVYQQALPALEPGDYRLTVEATAGRERAMREVAFRILASER